MGKERKLAKKAKDTTFKPEDWQTKASIVIYEEGNYITFCPRCELAFLVNTIPTSQIDPILPWLPPAIAAQAPRLTFLRTPDDKTIIIIAEPTETQKAPSAPTN